MVNHEQEGKCALCGVSFPKKRSWQKFCCDAHRVKYHRTMKPSVIRREFTNIRKELSEIKDCLSRLKGKVGR